MDELKLKVTSSPHLRAPDGTRSIMLDVIIALIPALAAGCYIFGARALLVTAISVVSCVVFEFLYRKLMKKSSSVGDLSAVVTGILLAFTLPSTVPWWIPVVGSFFAIVIVKQLFGGIGKNFMNPALAGRAFLFSWPAIMSKWVVPLSYDSFFNFSLDAVTTATTVDGVSSATPLASLHSGVLPEGTGLLSAFFGQVGGCIGEISAFALLLGGLYLILRRIISARIPLAYLLTVAVLCLIFPKGGDRISWMLWNLCSGGLMLGAIFMATDYTTSPVNSWAQIVFGIGCGLITVFIRYFGSYVEGVSYAILIMNVCVWLLDKAFKPRRFGVTREYKRQEKLARKAKKEAEA